MSCANCAQDHGPIDECMLGVAAMVLRDRLDLDDDTVRRLIARVDASEFWDRYGGPTVDWLEGQLEEA